MAKKITTFNTRELEAEEAENQIVSVVTKVIEIHSNLEVENIVLSEVGQKG